MSVLLDSIPEGHSLLHQRYATEPLELPTPAPTKRRRRLVPPTPVQGASEPNTKCPRCRKRVYRPLVFSSPAIEEQFPRVAGSLFRTTDGRMFIYRCEKLIAVYCSGCSLDLQHCRVCGCTEEVGCDDGCWWIKPDLCSSCRRAKARAA